MYVLSAAACDVATDESVLMIWDCLLHLRSSNGLCRNCMSGTRALEKRSDKNTHPDPWEDLKIRSPI